MKIKSILLFFLLTTCLFLSHCGQETVGDTAAREQDRQRERNNLYANQNKIINGIYQGHIQGDIDLGRGKTRVGSLNSSDVYLIVSSTKFNSGDVTGTPTIAGTLILAPAITTSNEPAQYIYPFSNGQFTPLVGDTPSSIGTLTFTPESQNPQVNFACDVDVKLNMDCSWNALGGAKIKLSSTTEKSLAVLNKKSKAAMVYIGETDQFNIVVEFESGVVPRDSSNVPMPTILGRISFTSKNGGAHVQPFFKASSIDWVHSRLSLTLSDDTPGSMNCTIIGAGQSLDCDWQTSVHRKFIVTRSLKK